MHSEKLQIWVAQDGRASWAAASKPNVDGFGEYVVLRLSIKQSNAQIGKLFFPFKILFKRFSTKMNKLELRVLIYFLLLFTNM